jgi:hypothetical protein
MILITHRFQNAFHLSDVSEVRTLSLPTEVTQASKGVKELFKTRHDYVQDLSLGRSLLRDHYLCNRARGKAITSIQPNTLLVKCMIVTSALSSSFHPGSFIPARG